MTSCVTAAPCRCVTHAMKADLVSWGIPQASLHVVHDCAAPFFCRATLPDSHDLFRRLRPVLAAPVGMVRCCNWSGFVRRLFGEVPECGCYRAISVVSSPTNQDEPVRSAKIGTNISVDWSRGGGKGSRVSAKYLTLMVPVRNRRLQVNLGRS